MRRNRGCRTPDPGGPTVAICIATCGRPKAVEQALQSLSEQELAPVGVLVIDASDGRDTELVCDRLASAFPTGVFRYARSERGLPVQRRLGIEMLRETEPRYICLADDDVMFAPDFLSETVSFLESAEGREYGGVSGYSMLGWGRPFERLERMYSKLGIYDGELIPGRWLYCGSLVLLSRLTPFEGIYQTEYIPGTHAVWRTEVFDRFLPPRELGGYALWEDVHLSLRVGTAFKLGVLGQARAWHNRAPGGRPGRVRLGFQSLRRQALILRDCDPAPSWRRYAAFLAFAFPDLVVRTAISVVRLRWSALPDLVGSMGGWISCVVRPPRTTSDALVHHRRADVTDRRPELASSSEAENR